MSGGPDLSESTQKVSSSEKKVPDEDAEKLIHTALGGGKPADVMLWRNIQISGALLAGASMVWLLFQGIGYHLVTFICHSLILSLTSLFVWSNLNFFVNKTPVKFPEMVLPEAVCTRVALFLTDKCNKAVSIFRAVAYGNDMKKLLYAVLTLWVVPIIGSYFDFLSLVYIMTVMLLTTPLLYEKHQDQVDTYAKKAKDKLNKQISKLEEKVLQKLPQVPPTTDEKQE